MADEDLNENEPLSAEDVLTFGPCVEAQVWTPIWIQEARAPIAVAAGRPKLGPVFNEQGVGKAALIRPCVSRGRRIRGLPPIYTPQMLEANASVFDGWPQFTDHIPPELSQALQKRGRSVRELGGQVLKGVWARDFVHEDDRQYGYRKGAIVADVWANKLIRETVGENPNLLHTSINAWPTSGKPGTAPWRSDLKGMLIEGIRRQPQGSVDYVVRGGAGGRLLLEGVEDEGEWPEVGEWSEDDTRFVVSLAERLYASPRMPEVTLPSKPDELREWLSQNAPHLLPALQEQDAEDEPAIKALMKKGKTRKQAEAIVAGSSEEKTEEGVTESDVQRMIEESQSGTPTVEEFEQRLTESYENLLNEREQQRQRAARAHALIESAEGVPPSWKADLKARYSMLPSGPPPALLVEGEHNDKDGNELSEEQVVEQRVKDDLQHVRDLIAEAQGKPRVTGEGGARRDGADDRAGTKRTGDQYWRTRFVEMGIVESEDKALDIYGEKVED